MTSRSDPARITVLGADFGALSTERELRRRNRTASITLVAPRAELHWWRVSPGPGLVAPGQVREISAIEPSNWR